MKIEKITEKELQNILDEFKRFQSTYFWTPPSSASARRSEEKRNSKEWNFIVDNKTVTAKITVSCSCKNYYSTREIKVDSENKKMMIPFLKKLIENGEFPETQTIAN